MKCAGLLASFLLFASVVHADAVGFVDRAATALGTPASKLQFFLDEVVTVSAENKVNDASRVFAVGDVLETDKNGNTLLSAYKANLADGSESATLVVIDSTKTKAQVLTQSGTMLTAAATSAKFSEIPGQLAALQAELAPKFPEIDFQPLEMLGLLNFGPKDGASLTVGRMLDLLRHIKSSNVVDQTATGFAFLSGDGIVSGSLLEAPLLLIKFGELSSISGKSRLSDILIKRKLTSHKLLWTISLAAPACNEIFQTK